MTRKDTRNTGVLRGIAPLIAVLTVMIALAALAQRGGQPSGEASAVTPPVDAAITNGAPVVTTDGARRFPVGSSHAKRRRPDTPSSPLFLPAVTYDPGGTYPLSVAVGDLNGDHKPDLVVYNQNSPNNESLLGVLLGKGDGTFQPVVTYDPGGRSLAPTTVVIADLNNDHKPDLAVVNGSTGNFGVLLGNGDGTFQPAATNLLCAGGSGWANALAVADVNRDGKPDLLVDNGGCEDSVVVLLGNGDGTFSFGFPGSYYWSGGLGDDSITAVDVNGDGKPDVIVANGYNGASNNVGVLLGNGDGTLQSVVTYYPGDWNPTSVAVSDVNGDGKPDLIVANGGSGGINTLGILLGNGDGTFQPVVATTWGGSYHPSFVVVADVNGDGHPDLVVADYSVDGNHDGAVSVLLGFGDGTFEPATTYSSGGTGAVSLAVVDLNGDGKLDLLVANNLYNNVGVLLNNGSTLSPTTTTLASSLNPSTFGQLVTFTASVSSGAGTPTGTVEFFDGTTLLGSGTLTSGNASFSTSGLAVSSHSIVAKYEGDGGYRLSISDPISQIVSRAATTTSLISSLNPAVINQFVTYTATVTSQYGGAVTGTVAFQDGGTTVATVTLAGSQAAYRTKYSSSGAHSIAATYSGDTNNTGSLSATVVEQIKGYASKTVLTTSGSPSFVGQAVTFTATVTSGHGAIPNGELVTFYDGTTAIGTGSTASGAATFTTSSLTAKTHTIKATYGGDAIFSPSSGTVTQIVNKYPTTTTLTSSLNPSQFGQAVVFTAHVTSSGPTPTGKVKFLDGTLAIGSATLSGGVAKLTKSNLAVGTHSITAHYNGDAASSTSTSAVVNQVVH
jgi:hypothetical protein